jgi:hypothetical protein
MNDILVGSVAVPGVVAALVAAAWGLFSQRALRQLEARLARQGEAFRLAQSPRVEAALGLWVAVSAYERAVADLVVRFDPLAAGDADEAREAVRSHRALGRLALRRAHRRLVAARARAECLVPGPAFLAVEALRLELAEADALSWRALLEGREDGDAAELYGEAGDRLEAATRLRPAAVAALRAVIDAP